jgi:lipopolysaccharide export system protein LptC
MNIKLTINKYSRKLNISYARYLKFKRADRQASHQEITFAEKHTARVAYLKKFIIRMVILLSLLIIVWPLVNKNWGGSKLEFQNNDKPVAGIPAKDDSNLPVMLKPKFFGNDDNGQPFNITSDSGVSVNENKTILTNIKSDMALKDNTRLKLASAHGDYASKDKKLILNDGVVINTESGYILKTNSAYVKLNENMATGSEKVYITGDLGDIQANSFTIKNSGEEIVLFGGVILNTEPEKKD